MMRIEFDSTLDELVDVSMRLAGETAAFRRQRFWAQATVGGAFAVTVIATVLMRAGPRLPVALSIAAAVAIAGGFLAGYLYGHVHSWLTRRNCRQIVTEMFGGADRHRCQYELRPDVLWCKTPDAEVSLPWSRLKRVKERADSIELWFDPGLAVVRDRAFPAAVDREAFLEAVAGLSRPTAA